MHEMTENRSVSCTDAMFRTSALPGSAAGGPACLRAPRLTSQKLAGRETWRTCRAFSFLVTSALERCMFRKHLYFLFLFLHQQPASPVHSSNSKRSAYDTRVFTCRRAQDRNESETGEARAVQTPGLRLEPGLSEQRWQRRSKHFLFVCFCCSSL